MFWKRTEETEKKFKQFNDVLKKSFSNVKKDTSNIFQWLNYLYRKGVDQERMIRELQLELKYMPRTREDIRRIIDDYYSFEGIMQRIRELDNKINQLFELQVQTGRGVIQEAPGETPIELSQIEKRLERLETRRMSMRERIIKRLTRNSKEYVKSVILSYIKKYEKISAVQLKEIVVEEQNFCSKSSFYRILEEIEELDEIGFIKHGKEKLYIFKLVKKV